MIRPISTDLQIACILMLAWLLFGCSKDKNIVGNGDLTTISGFVLNVDNGAPALAAKVFLLDHEDTYSTVVDANGQFSLQVPHGERLLLVVDDADATLQGPPGNWYRMLNFDPIFQETIPESGLQNHLIHACPNPQVFHADSLSGIAVWNHYLAKEDALNGDLFDVTNTDDATIVGGAFLQTLNGDFLAIENMTVAIDENDFWVAYSQAGNYSNGSGLPDATLAGMPFHPGSRTKTDASGAFLSFVSARTGEITLRIIDGDQSRGLAFNTPHKVPIRPQMVTFLLPGGIDGEANKSPYEVIDAAGFFGVPVAKTQFHKDTSISSED